MIREEAAHANGSRQLSNDPTRPHATPAITQSKRPGSSTSKSTYSSTEPLTTYRHSLRIYETKRQLHLGSSSTGFLPLPLSFLFSLPPRLSLPFLLRSNQPSLSFRIPPGQPRIYPHFDPPQNNNADISSSLPFYPRPFPSRPENRRSTVEYPFEPFIRGTSLGPSLSPERLLQSHLRLPALCHITFRRSNHLGLVPRRYDPPARHRSGGFDNLLVVLGLKWGDRSIYHFLIE